MTLTELADRIGMTLANLSILKTGKARAVRFPTLEAICEALQCQPGDLLEFTSIEADFHDLATAPSQDSEAALETKTFRSFNEKELATPHSGKMNTRTKSDSQRLGEGSPRAKANVKRAHRGCWIELTVLSSLPNSATGLPTIHMAGEDHLKSNSCALN